MAHSPVLAASSDVLHHMLVASHHETFIDGAGIVPVRNVTPDVLRITLDFIYGVTPTSRADFERLRIGAARLGIEGAYEYCCRRLGESTSGLQHVMSVATTSPPASEAVTTEATTDVEPPCTASSEDVALQSEDLSTGDHSCVNEKANSDVVEMSEESADVTDSVVSSDDVSHAAMMAHMSLADLARSDECPHLRRIAGEILSAPILEPECLPDESSGSLDDSDGLLESVQLRKRLRNSIQCSNQGSSSIHEECTGLSLYKMAESDSVEKIPCTVAANHTGDLPSVADSAVTVMPVTLEPTNSRPQTIFAENTAGGIQHSTADSTVPCLVSVATSAAFSTPLYATASISSFSTIPTKMATDSAPDESVSGLDYYPMSCDTSDISWPNDGHLGMANLPSLPSHVPPFGGGFSGSFFSMANIMGIDGTTVNSVCSRPMDAANGSAGIIDGCKPDMNFADFSSMLSTNPWPNTTAISQPHAGANGMCQIVSQPIDNGVVFSYGPSSVVSAVQPFVSPGLTMNHLPSSSASVETARTVVADLSYISLDDVSAVLKENGFSDKTLSPSASEVSATANHSTDNHASETRTGENHTSDVIEASTQNTVTRVCVFCQKLCKSER